MRWHYTRSMLAEALVSVGIGEGDVLFSHLAPPALGFTKDLADVGSVAPTILGAILDVIGTTGTFITPTYSYSFCSGEDFNPQQTPGRVGGFGEWFRRQKGVIRSEDPIFSVAGIGPAATALFHGLPKDCFGQGCLYERLLESKTKVCNIGLTLLCFTPIHYLEKTVGVPYRYDKFFTGYVCRDGRQDKESWIYHVRANIPHSRPNMAPAVERAQKKGIVRKADVGLGSVWGAELEEVYAHYRRELANNPWALVVGPACDVLVEEQARTDVATYDCRFLHF